MHIDLANPADFQSIARIYNEYIEMGNATMEEMLHSKEDIANWVNKFNERERLYTVKIDEKVIGWGIIKRYSDREGYRFACETAIYLTASERGKGYGSTLKKYIITQCRLLNYRHLVAKIFASNKASIEYNIKLGYTVVGIQKQIGFRNNKWQDIAILQYVLEPDG